MIRRSKINRKINRNRNGNELSSSAPQLLSSSTPQFLFSSSSAPQLLSSSAPQLLSSSSAPQLLSSSTPQFLLSSSSIPRLLSSSTLMEALVALAITSLLMWMVFTSIGYTLTPINPQRKLEAILLADSLIQTISPTAQEHSEVKTIKGFEIHISTTPYADSLQLCVVQVDVHASAKHKLVSRKRISAPQSSVPQSLSSSAPQPLILHETKIQTSSLHTY